MVLAHFKASSFLKGALIFNFSYIYVFSTLHFLRLSSCKCPSCVSPAAEADPAVPLRLPDVRFGACRQETVRDAFSSSGRKTESHQEQILTQVSSNTWTYLKMTG